MLESPEAAAEDGASTSVRPVSWRERQAAARTLGMRLLQRFEWACEWSAYWLKRWAFLDVLDRLGRLAIVVAVATWLWGIPARRQEAEDQRKAKIYQAWQVLNTAQGNAGGGGRIEALNDLVLEGQSLVGVDLSYANLTGLDLIEADLTSANLEAAVLHFSNLTGTNLERANLRNAELLRANLRHARIKAAQLQDAYMVAAELHNADLGPNFMFGFLARDVTRFPQFAPTALRRANLAGAVFRDANLLLADFEDASLDGADLRGANVEGTNFRMANLQGVDLAGVRNWRKISSLELANIHGVENAPSGFEEWATDQMGAVQIEDYLRWMTMKTQAAERSTSSLPGDTF